MSKGYEIPIKASNVEDSINKLDELLRKMKEVNRSAIDLRVRGGSGGYGGSSGRGGGGGGGRSSGPSDPWTRLERANAGLGIGGSENELNAARLRQVRAQKAVDRANKELNPEPNDPLKTMFMRTRLKIGPWQPLVGDLVKNGLLPQDSQMMSMVTRITSSAAAKSAVAAAAASAAPLILGAAGLTAVAYGAYKLAEVGSALNTPMTGAQFRAGGIGGRSTAQANSMAGYFGTDVSGMASIAEQVGQRLNQGGYASGTLRKFGIVDMGRHTLDKFDNLTKVMDALRKMSEKEAIMVARDLGQPELARVRLLSDKTYKDLKDSGGMQTEKERKQTEEYNAKRTIIGNRIDNLYRQITLPAIEGLNSAYDLANPDLSDPMRSLKAAYDVILKGQVKGLELTTPGRLFNAGRQIYDHFATPSKEKPKDDQTKAIEENTRALKDHKEVIGGGPRSRGAVPVGWKHQMLEESLNSQAMTLGAFNVG